MSRPGDPLALWRLSLESAFLFTEAWSVIALRSLSMSGMRPMSPAEPLRMMLEKPPAFLASGVAAYLSAASGRSAEDIVASSLRPLRKEARANRRRLTAAPHSLSKRPPPSVPAPASSSPPRESDGRQRSLRARG